MARERERERESVRREMILGCCMPSKSHTNALICSAFVRCHLTNDKQTQINVLDKKCTMEN